MCPLYACSSTHTGSLVETAAQHARYFATAAADQQLDDASAERVLRVEGAKGRVPRVAVKRVVEFWPTRAAGLARRRPTAELARAADARARRRRASRACRAGPASPGLPPGGGWPWKAPPGEISVTQSGPARSRGLGDL